jgi:hypothetical protein
MVKITERNAFRTEVREVEVTKFKVITHEVEDGQSFSCLEGTTKLHGPVYVQTPPFGVLEIEAI